MAKKKSKKKKKQILIKLLHKESGHAYYTFKNPKNDALGGQKAGKLELMKFNPMKGYKKHVKYIESKA
jgi:ribosomal protein L33